MMVLLPASILKNIAKCRKIQDKSVKYFKCVYAKNADNKAILFSLTNTIDRINDTLETTEFGKSSENIQKQVIASQFAMVL